MATAVVKVDTAVAKVVTVARVATAARAATVVSKVATKVVADVSCKC